MCIFVSNLKQKFYFNGQVNDNERIFDHAIVVYNFFQISLGYFSQTGPGNVTSFTLYPRFGKMVELFGDNDMLMFSEFQYKTKKDSDTGDEDEDEDDNDDDSEGDEPLLSCIESYSWEKNNTELTIKVSFGNEFLKCVYAIIIMNNTGKLLRLEIVNKNVKYDKLIYYDLIIDDPNSAPHFKTVDRQTYHYYHWRCINFNASCQ